MNRAGIADLPIGIFDSGVGGLTVLSALVQRLPSECYCYLGDTARLPYGTKGKDTIIRYALQATEQLVQRRVKLLVVACNTATAAALPDLQRAYPHIPVVGVVEPGAKAACAASRSGAILVLATESTIHAGAYTSAIKALRPDADVLGVPCTLFVSLAEEGWMSGEVAEAIARRYLTPVFANGRANRMPPDCVVLACTHFPPLMPSIATALKACSGAQAVPYAREAEPAASTVIMVDSAATTAEAVERELRSHALLNPRSASPDSRGTLHFLTTDLPERFARVGSLFLGAPIVADDVELVTL